MKRVLLASALERVTTKPWRRVESMPAEESWPRYLVAGVIALGGFVALLVFLGVSL